MPQISLKINLRLKKSGLTPAYIYFSDTFPQHSKNTCMFTTLDILFRSRRTKYFPLMPKTLHIYLSHVDLAVQCPSNEATPSVHRAKHTRQYST